MSWERLVDRAVTLAEGGDPDEAVDLAMEAVMLAADVGPGALARALVTLGYARILSGELDGGREDLREAIAVAPPDDHATLADAWHHLGAALQHADDLKEAETALRQALHHREAAWGADHPHLAKGWGDLARIAFQRGGRGAGVSSLLLRGQGILERAIASPPAGHDVAELRFDACTIASNLVLVRMEDGRWDEALRSARAAVEHLEAFAALGRDLPGGVSERLDGYLAAIEAEATEDEGADALRARIRRIAPPELEVETVDDLDLSAYEQGD